MKNKKSSKYKNTDSVIEVEFLCDKACEFINCFRSVSRQVITREQIEQLYTKVNKKGTNK